MKSKQLDLFERKEKKPERGIGYEMRLKDISYIEAKQLVLNKVTEFHTKQFPGMMWTQRTKAIFFYNTNRILIAIYNKTIRDFWFLKKESE